jgi:hypothetical protein
MLKTDIKAFEHALRSLQSQRAEHLTAVQEIDEGLAKLGIQLGEEAGSQAGQPLTATRRRGRPKGAVAKKRGTPKGSVARKRGRPKKTNSRPSEKRGSAPASDVKASILAFLKSKGGSGASSQGIADHLGLKPGILLAQLVKEGKVVAREGRDGKVFRVG